MCPGIPDDLFIQGPVPMTKEEVRVVSLSKLAIKTDSIVYDIGAGTGSVTVEAALLAKAGRVYAIERHPAALDLIKQNIDKFGVDNARLVAGEAPECLKGLPAPDRIFIGGGGGKLGEIIAYASGILPKHGRLVLNTVTVESMYQGISLLEAGGFAVGAVTLWHSRLKKAGKVHLWQSLNPVTVIWGIKEDG